MEYLKYLLVFFAVMSVLAVILTVYDKICAKKHGHRIPESALLLTGLFLGAEAELITMLIIRHKTKHKEFMIGLPLMIVLHIVSGFVFYYFFIR